MVAVVVGVAGARAGEAPASFRELSAGDFDGGGEVAADSVAEKLTGSGFIKLVAAFRATVTVTVSPACSDCASGAA